MAFVDNGGTGVNDPIGAVYKAAMEADAAGLCILPPSEDGAKRPWPNSRGQWDQFKTRRPDHGLLSQWYPGRSGLGIVAGAVSGNVEPWDFDDRQTYEAFVAAARAIGLGGVIDRIEAGYCDDTAGNGVRWLARYSEGARTEFSKDREILARRPKEPHEKKHDKDNTKILIEITRFSILAPTNGKVHPSGKPYVRRSGGFATITSYTVEERDALIELARSFDAMPRSAAEPPPRGSAKGAAQGLRPGDDYSAQTTWGDVLVGWTRVYERGGTTYWRRAGKTFGVSATTNFNGSDLLYVFTSSTEFEPDKSYSRFGAYAVLNHASDFAAAAKALAKEGFGAKQARGDRRGAPQPDQDGETREYRQGGRGIEWFKHGKDKDDSILLTNFAATIESEVTLDDDVETRKEFEIIAGLHGREYRFAVPASQFSSLNWVIERLGARAIVQPGQATARRVAVAVQTLSGEVPERRVFTHTGWRLIDGSWLYMHAGGALGPDGPVSGIEVQLPEELARFVLPPVIDRESLREAVEASTNLLNVAPHSATVPLLGGVYRSVLGNVDFGIHIAGQTGVKKTELAALGQQHLGAELSARTPPASWLSTGNSIEVTAFSAKDAPLLVDDFVPQGTAVDRARQNAIADRVIRALGNKTGRGRLRPDGTQRRARPPRAFILSTGEEIPAGHSLRARLVVVQVQPGDVIDEALTIAQQDAASGAYATAMAGYISWLAPQLDKVREDLRRFTHERRVEVPATAHSRTADNIAQLSAAWSIWLRFVVVVGAATPDEATQIDGAVWQTLKAIATEQGALQRVYDPVDRYFSLINSVLSSGKGHIPSATQPDRPPEGADIARAMGWRRLTDGAWQAQGACIGWWAADGIYLEPEVSYALAQQMGAASGEGVSVAPSTLHRRMFERKLLLSTEKRGGELRLRVRKGIGGQRKHVLHVAHSHLLSPNTGPTGPTGPGDENDEE